MEGEYWADIVFTGDEHPDCQSSTGTGSHSEASKRAVGAQHPELQQKQKLEMNRMQAVFLMSVGEHQAS